MTIQNQAYTIPSDTGRSIALDISLPASDTQAPLVVFTHGFKGFKDWGYWHLIAKKFAEAGYAFLKFNFSYNGTKPAYPSEFVDLEAFGGNTFSKELTDIKSVLDWAHATPELHGKLDLENVTLIGHSRGGGIGIIAAHEDARIHQLITWASVDCLNYLWKDKNTLLKKWKKKGVHHIKNGRTRQDMPLNWSLVEDFENNQQRFDIEAVMPVFSKKMCVIHGKDDSAIPAVAAQNLHLWNPKAVLYLVDGADHVFGGSHPYEASYLPIYAQVLFSRSLHFLEQ